MIFGGYRTVWVIVLFDLPTDTAEARADSRLFRDALLKDGFGMMQYSVYARHCASQENAYVHQNRIKSALPPDGEVRIICLTDKQYGRMKVYFGRSRAPAEAPPQQVMVF